MIEKLKKVHFVGIGGSGMSGLALLFHNLGFEVTGSNLGPTSYTPQLERAGVPVIYSHSPDNVGDAEAVIYSPAVPSDNPELVEARNRDLYVIPRFQALAEVSQFFRKVVGITGAHGKTTTTALLGTILRKAGFNPTVLNGGIMVEQNSSLWFGGDEILVVEVDESQPEGLRYLFPSTVLVVSLDWVHPHQYKSVTKLFFEIESLVLKSFEEGEAVLNVDWDMLSTLYQKYLFYKDHVFTYGISSSLAASRVLWYEPAWEGWKGEFRVLSGEVEVKTPLKGTHHLVNALGACVTARLLGCRLSDLRDGLAEFKGVKRRMEVLGTVGGREVISDYAHHPTEISSVLDTVERFFSSYSVIFEPHRFTRFQKLWDGFLRALTVSGKVYVLPVYPAGTSPIPGVSSERFVRELRERGVDARPLQPDGVRDVLRDGEEGPVLGLGAGSVDSLLRRLVSEHQHGVSEREEPVP